MILYLLCVDVRMLTMTLGLVKFALNVLINVKNAPIRQCAKLVDPLMNGNILNLCVLVNLDFSM
jgi:hypothetical protein